jgi:hypothetical protein
MLKVISQIGTNYGVIDTDDGIIEWTSADALKKYMQEGVVIDGVYPTGIAPLPIELDWTLCNWCNNENIFKHMKMHTFYENGTFSIRCDNKKTFKGRWQPHGNDSIALKFNIGIRTYVKKSIFH